MTSWRNKPTAGKVLVSKVLVSKVLVSMVLRELTGARAFTPGSGAVNAP